MHHVTQDQVIAFIRECKKTRDNLGLSMMYLHALRVSEGKATSFL